MLYEKKVVGASVEKQIVTAMIVSSEFLSRVYPLINLDFFVNDYAKEVCKWVMEYYKTYKSAPELNIKTIYESYKSNLEKNTADLIASFLSKISEEFTEEGDLNIDHIYDNTLKYFSQRDNKLRLAKASELNDQGKTEEAIVVMRESTLLTQTASGWENPLSSDSLLKLYTEEELDESLHLPGALGEFLGPLKIGWLIGLLGGFKVGKSFTINEFGIAALTQKWPVAHFSLEMSMKDVSRRYLNRILGANQAGTYLFPVFDCLKNQTGICDDARRKNKVTLRSTVKEELKYIEGYTPCTVCRGTKDFIPETYYTKTEVKTKTLKTVRKEVNLFKQMYGGTLMIKVYPRFSASVDDIRTALDILEYQDGLAPKLTIVDMADILRPSARLYKAEPRHGLDDIWKTLAGLGSERQSLVITPSQGNRGSLKKIQKDETDLAEWIGKLGHVDVFGALNQTPMEKVKGVMRFNLLAHRHKDFNVKDFLVILRHLSTGQSYLDSERIPRSYYVSSSVPEEED